MLLFFIGAMFGGIVGLIAFALVSANKDGDG